MAAEAGAIDRLVALQPHSERKRERVVRILRSAQSAQVPIDCGLSQKIERRTAAIASVGTESLALSLADFRAEPGETLRPSFFLSGRKFCFETVVLSASRNRLQSTLPTAISVDERRSRLRRPAESVDVAAVTLEVAGRKFSGGRIIDSTPEGLCLRLPSTSPLPNTGAAVRLNRGFGPEHGEIRYKKAIDNMGLVQLGIEIKPAIPRQIDSEKLESIERNGVTSPQWIRRNLSTTASIVGAALDRATEAFYERRLPPVEVVDFSDRNGQLLRGIIDSWGASERSTAVVIPPAWGRTKETLSPLAHTIVSCFKAADEPVRVLRFDGVGKRGESYREPSAQVPGLECTRMRFSQGVDDIIAAVDYLHSGSIPDKTIVVSFSASSIEARRALAVDRRVGGWVCVVGSADLQSMMKRISGGIDFALGIERGIQFGNQEILGVTVDMDRAGRDALDHNLVYMGDARVDMNQIQAPVTWIHGRSDAWMDLDRVKDILGQGDPSNRRLVEAPIGHMLRSSSEALSVFRFVASEIGRMAGKAFPPNFPVSGAELLRKQRAERKRRPQPSFEPRSFWKHYLLGGPLGIGYELMSSISPFRDLMSTQVEALQVRAGDRVLDLGSGTGSALPYLSGKRPAQVIELDLVFEAMRKARMRGAGGSGVHYLQAHVGNGKIPLADKSVDRVLASLLLSYVSEREQVLEEIARVVRPGGRIVLSTLVRDADMSKLLIEGMGELQDAVELFPEGVTLSSAVRDFSNEASRLLDLEEHGAFQFWEAEELSSFISSLGWKVDFVQEAFGDPPQAIVVGASSSGTP